MIKMIFGRKRKIQSQIKDEGEKENKNNNDNNNNNGNYSNISNNGISNTSYNNYNDINGVSEKKNSEKDSLNNRNQENTVVKDVGKSDRDNKESNQQEMNANCKIDGDKMISAFVDRFSVRSYLMKKVEFEKVSYLLEAARWAPTSGNLQELRYVVVDNKETIQKLSVASYNQMWMASAPLHIIILADLEKLSKHFGPRGEKIYSIMDGAIAAEHIMLEASVLDLGSCLVGAFYDEKVKEIIGAPKNSRVIAIVTVGYPFNATRITNRENLDGKVFFNKYSVKFINPDFVKGNYRIGDKITTFLNKLKKQFQQKR